MNICRTTQPQHGSAFDLHRFHRTHIVLAIIDHSQSIVYSDSFLVFELRGFRTGFQTPRKHHRPLGDGAADSRCCRFHGGVADFPADIRERLSVAHQRQSRRTSREIRSHRKRASHHVQQCTSATPLVPKQKRSWSTVPLWQDSVQQ